MMVPNRLFIEVMWCSVFATDPTTGEFYPSVVQGWEREVTTQKEEAQKGFYYVSSKPTLPGEPVLLARDSDALVLYVVIRCDLIEGVTVTEYMHYCIEVATDFLD